MIFVFTHSCIALETNKSEQIDYQLHEKLQEHQMTGNLLDVKINNDVQGSFTKSFLLWPISYTNKSELEMDLND